MRQMKRVGLAVLMLLSVAAASQAQTLGTIAGVARDTSGAVLPGVAVEVASPALIEKTRSAVTDGSGQYTIINLPVGTYDVTFTLQGFSTVKRDSVNVLANFTAQINAELKVGAVAETVTVTGESPLIDVQGTVTARAVTPDVIKAIPNGGTMYQLAAMMPGVSISGGQDVGGSSGSPVGAQLSAHGGTGNDEVQLVDGVRVGNMMGGSRTQQTLSPLLYDEVDVQLSGQGGEAVSIGVTTNSIPRSGGNRFSGTILANGSGPGLQTSNLTSRLMGLGLTATSSLKSLFDVNGSIGGPIVKDRLWFYATERYQTNSTYAAGIFYPVNPLPTPGNLTRVATADQGYNPQYLWDNTGRLTAAVTPKLRVNGLAIVQRKWWPYFPGVSATVAPESVEQVTWPGRIYQGSATYAATSRLLFEGGMNYQDSSDWWAPVPIANNIGGNAVRVVEQGTTLANGTVISPLTYGPLTPNLVSDNPMKMQRLPCGHELRHGHAQPEDRHRHPAGLPPEPVVELDHADSVPDARLPVEPGHAVRAARHLQDESGLRRRHLRPGSLDAEAPDGHRRHPARPAEGVLRPEHPRADAVAAQPRDPDHPGRGRRGLEGHQSAVRRRLRSVRRRQDRVESVGRPRCGRRNDRDGPRPQPGLVVRDDHGHQRDRREPQQHSGLRFPELRRPTGNAARG